MNKKVLLINILTLALLFCGNIYAQRSIQLSDIELVNWGDGQLYGHNRDEKKTAIEGNVRIITGFTTEYIDANFDSKGLAIGKWEYYKNNKLAEVTNYTDGYENGEKLSYHGDGTTLKSKVNLVNGKVNGTFTSFDSNGNKEQEKTMKNGVDDGPERTYRDGEVVSEIIFKNGKAEGKSFAILNKGNNDCYKKNENYKNGQLDGEYKEEYCDGGPKVTGKYIVGKKDGLWEYFKKDGSRNKPTEGYEKGDLTKKITYFTNGNISSEKNFKNNKEDGTSKTYEQDGTLKSEKNYVAGKQVGKQTQYYTSNHNDFIQVSNYSENGKMDGEFLETFVDPKTVKTKGQYVNGEKHGKWITSDINGSVVKETNYEKGKVTGSKKVQKNEKSFNYPAYTETTLYDANDYKSGEYIEIYDVNKKTKQKGQYVKGRQDGKWLFYDENGKLIKEEIYENGLQKSSQKF